MKQVVHIVYLYNELYKFNGAMSQYLDNLGKERKVAGVGKGFESCIY